MGQAFITRRGGGNGRFATGVYGPPTGATNEYAYQEMTVTGLGFLPKQIMLFEKSNFDAYHVENMVWTSSGGIVSKSVDDGPYEYQITVTPVNDGFSVKITSNMIQFHHLYYWFAFEKEQEV